MAEFSNNRKLGNRATQSVSALDFGLSESGTAAANATALQAAIDAVGTNISAWHEPPEVLVPNGTYALTSVAINDIDVHIKGEGAVFQTTGSYAFDVGSAADLDVLTGGLNCFRMSGCRIELAATTTGIRNRGYRTFQLEHLHITGGAVGLDTQGAFAKSYAHDVTCQLQTTIGFDIKIHNNLMRFTKCRALSSIPIGIQLGTYSGSPPSVELEGVQLTNMDVSGCVTGISTTGLVKNLTIDTLYTESNTGKDLIIENATGGSNKQGILILNSHFDSSAGLGTQFGTDQTSGTTLRNLNVLGCEFADSKAKPAWAAATAYTTVGSKTTSEIPVRSITGAVKAGGVDVVLTMDTDKLNDGDSIVVSGVAGMTELNYNTYTVKVTKVSGNASVELVGTSAGSYSAYTSGGLAFPTETTTYRNQVSHTSGGSGTHTGGAAAAVLTDSTQSWGVNDLVGYVLHNTANGQKTQITANTSDTITGVLTGGETWDNGDTWTIDYFQNVDLANGNWAEASVSFVGGNIIYDSKIDSFFTGVVRHDAAQTGLVNDSTTVLAGETMPLYPVNPALPYGNADTKGRQGLFLYDDDYIYIKTGAGWKRVAISTF